MSKKQESVHSKTEMEELYESSFNKHTQNIPIDFIMGQEGNKTGNKNKQIILRAKQKGQIRKIQILKMKQSCGQFEW